MDAVTAVSPNSAMGSKPKQSASELGQDDFMRLMVAQLKNQDPSQPMDNFQFLSQIAQFGTLSGVQGLQGALESLSGSLASNQGLQAATLVGRKVFTESGGGTLAQGGSLDGVVNLTDRAASVQVRIADAGGRLVRTLELGPQAAGRVEFTWDGRTAAGEQLASGTYLATAQALANGKAVAVPVASASTVASVSMGAVGAPLSLHLASGAVVGLDDISEYR